MSSSSVLGGPGVGTAFEGSGGSRLLGDWLVNQTDVNDDWWQDARSLAARHWWMYNNDPHVRAIAETLLMLVFGAKGLDFHSLYQADEEAATSPAEKNVRRQINAAMCKHFKGNRLDVAGHLSHRELSASLYLSKIMAGDGYAIRLWRPSRPWARRGTCWRLIDPSRVSNPNFGENTAKMFEGHELDADGGTIAIHVQTTHPNLVRYGATYAWVRVPLYAADGSRQVIHAKRVRRPDQIRGFGLLSATMLSMRMLSESAKAWVTAKRIQASIGLLIYCDNPAEMKRGDRNGALINSNVGIKPGMKWYVMKGTEVKPLDFNFQGSDFESFRNPILEAACASVPLPSDFVMRRLTKSNMASSRTSLGQAYETATCEQNEQIEQVESILVESAIREEVARGEIDVQTDDIDLLTQGRWSRPPKLSPNPLQEAQAVGEWAKFGRSLSGGFAEAGMDFDAEVAQSAQDNAYAEAQGVPILVGTGTTVSQSPQGNTGKTSDNDDDAAGNDGDDADADASDQEKTPGQTVST